MCRLLASIKASQRGDVDEAYLRQALGERFAKFEDVRDWSEWYNAEPSRRGGEEDDDP